MNKANEKQMPVAPRDSQAPHMTETDLAMAEFLDRVSLISGVTIQVYGFESPSNQSVIVGVSSFLSSEARSVIQLQGEMYRKYPGASVRVDVTESDLNVIHVPDGVLV